MLESLRNWNKERKLSPHERFALRVSRRIIENKRREAAGKPPKGWIVHSLEARPRYGRGDSSPIFVQNTENVGSHGESSPETEKLVLEQHELPTRPSDSNE